MWIDDKSIKQIWAAVYFIISYQHKHWSVEWKMITATLYVY